MSEFSLILVCKKQENATMDMERYKLNTVETHSFWGVIFNHGAI